MTEKDMVLDLQMLDDSFGDTDARGTPILTVPLTITLTSAINSACCDWSTASFNNC